MDDTNWGTAALLKGKEDANNIFKLHGLRVIRQIARYSTRGKDDYCYGKIERSKQIIEEQTKKK